VARNREVEVEEVEEVEEVVVAGDQARDRRGNVR